MIRVGDRVAVAWEDLADHPCCDPAWLGGVMAKIDCPHGKFFKTVITNIETTWMFSLLKRKEPIYCVEYGLIALKFKPIQRGSYEQDARSR